MLEEFNLWLKKISSAFSRSKANEQVEEIYSLHEAARRGELEMFYQPKVDMTNGMPVGVEALLRWRHPEFGLLAPGMFNAALKSPLGIVVIDLGLWGIQIAVKQISEWQKDGLVIPVSVNVMASELTNGDFCEWLKGVFEKYPDVVPSMLELEIVESSNLSDPERVTAVITKCRATGVKIALDDFGTGYSSLSYVRNIPSDHVKIDKTFVQDITHNHLDRGLVKFVITLAHSFDRKVIAEGVESLEHGLILMKLGCRYAQGYAIARPMAATDLPDWISQYNGHPEWKEGYLLLDIQPALFN